ncbi:hypothetical protein [Methanoregula sp.]|uniref:hypothetical protein n=1 Tax=Methanoregula sp. TaxID=2052170 RepID=UPI00236BA8E6|nr:hypothetical protein [Methanoregula sp.]MDD1686391.1 hypothetical protein [Methanoregula sp.]
MSGTPGSSSEKTRAPVQPVAIAIFSGSSTGETLMVPALDHKKVILPVGDFHKWDAIVSWDREMAGKMDV